MLTSTLSFQHGVTSTASLLSYDMGHTDGQKQIRQQFRLMSPLFVGRGIKITLHALFTSSQLQSSKKTVKWWLVLMAKVNVYEVCCAFCIQVPVSAVDGSRLPGVGTACVYHIAWCCDVSASCESCLPCRHSTRCCSSTSEWPCIAGAVDKHWLVTY